MNKVGISSLSDINKMTRLERNLLLDEYTQELKNKLEQSKI